MSYCSMDFYKILWNFEFVCNLFSCYRLQSLCQISREKNKKNVKRFPTVEARFSFLNLLRIFHKKKSRLSQEIKFLCGYEHWELNVKNILCSLLIIIIVVIIIIIITTMNITISIVLLKLLWLLLLLLLSSSLSLLLSLL